MEAVGSLLRLVERPVQVFATDGRSLDPPHGDESVVEVGELAGTRVTTLGVRAPRANSQYVVSIDLWISHECTPVLTRPSDE